MPVYYFLEKFMTALIPKIRQERQSIVEAVAQLFEETNEFLSATTARRNAQAQKQAEELQAFHKQLEQTSQEFLAQATQERIAQAQKQAEELQAFRKQLEQTSQEFLAETAQERISKAQKQAKELQAFRQDLFVSIFGVSSR
jgi:gas vesicle GvpC-like protein